MKRVAGLALWVIAAFVALGSLGAILNGEFIVFVVLGAVAGGLIAAGLSLRARETSRAPARPSPRRNKKPQMGFAEDFDDDPSS